MRKPIAASLFLLAASPWVCAAKAAPKNVASAPVNSPAALRLAIEDLVQTFGPRYPQGRKYLAALEAIERAGPNAPQFRAKLGRLRRESLLANPLLDFDKLLLVQRGGKGLGMPANHTCNSALPRQGYHDQIAVLSPARPDGQLRTLYRPQSSGYVGEIDLRWDGKRLLFTQSDRENWKIWEIGADGTGLRQVSRADADVDCFDPCYLPDGRIVFASTACYTGVPCWHGLQRACNLYVMDAGGTHVRQVCYDQDLDLYPSVLADGQVIFSRWDYTGIYHLYLRPLMVMNPDGAGQRAVYGSNSWWPNALYFPRAVPGSPNKIVAIVSGHHGVPRMGELVLIDLARGQHEAAGVVQRIPGRGRRIATPIRDNLVDDAWPKFLHPWPLSEKYVLVAASLKKGRWGIYLADVFDNLVLIHETPGAALLEPIPLKPRPRPPVLPDRTDPAARDAVVYLHDVYAGPGLAGVPRGAVKRLRLVSYEFGYPGAAGCDVIGIGGPWDAMRIVGTVPVEADGSAFFRVPANTPLSIQPLDAEGKALQLMRSWFTAMPGEHLSCTGCHEGACEAPAAAYARAATRTPSAITAWRGPPRGFSFDREVQPVLDRYCLACHDPAVAGSAKPDLRSPREAKDYQGMVIGGTQGIRLQPAVRAATGGRLRYGLAYEALLPYIRRVGIEDDVDLLVPGEYGADTSALVQLLRKGHHGVRLNAEAWDRLVTWIDLNGPCFGSWSEAFPVPDGARQRRVQLRRRYGGPADDPPNLPARPTPRPDPPPPQQPSPSPPQLEGWPFSAAEATRRQAARGPHEKVLDLGGGVTLKLARIPAGRFVMGSAAGAANEAPPCAVDIAGDFWIGVTEVTNAQYARFDPSHDSGRFSKRHARGDGPGLPLNGPAQPVVRVSWHTAMAFCNWLSRRTAEGASLPTEAQWEYACRAGTATAFNYGTLDDDFSSHENLADRSVQREVASIGGNVSMIYASLLKGPPSDLRFDDGFTVSAPVARFRPNAWGLFDMHGNVGEWTATIYRPYPYRDADGRNDPRADGPRVVRGGSFFQPPQDGTSAARWAYPPWRRVSNVGFRVVCRVKK